MNRHEKCYACGETIDVLHDGFGMDEKGHICLHCFMPSSWSEKDFECEDFDDDCNSVVMIGCLLIWMTVIIIIVWWFKPGWPFP